MSLLMFRVLNEFDIETDPLYNGLASKKLIYDLTQRYLLSNEEKYFKSLSSLEQDLYCKSKMMDYIKTHKHKIKKQIEKEGKKIKRNLENLKCADEESIIYLRHYLSSLNTHLSNGSRVYTDWISATLDLNSLKKYFDKQQIHKVAVLGSASNGFLDNNTLVLDLSSKEKIEEIKPLLSKKISDEDVKKIINKASKSELSLSELLGEEIFKPTSEKFMGYNYSSKDKEVCIYRYFPADNVVSVLETIQIELMSLKLFNIEFLKLDKNVQKHELERLKYILKQRILLLNDPYLMYVFEKIYLENKNIDVVKENVFERKKINQNRIKVLKMAASINNIQIKK